MDFMNTLFQQYIVSSNKDEFLNNFTGSFTGQLEAYIHSRLKNENVDNDISLLILVGDKTDIEKGISKDLDYLDYAVCKEKLTLNCLDYNYKELIKQIKSYIDKNIFTVIWYTGHGENYGSKYPAIYLKNNEIFHLKTLCCLFKRYVINKNFRVVFFFDCCNKGKKDITVPNIIIQPFNFGFLKEIKWKITYIFAAEHGHTVGIDESGSHFLRYTLNYILNKSKGKNNSDNLIDFFKYLDNKTCFFRKEYGDHENEIYNEIFQL